MAVKIRLKRMGKKKAPFYRIVVADSRSPRDGRFIEEIGTYDPTKEPAVVAIDAEKAKAWIANGAQPTDTVKFLIKKAPSTLLLVIRFQRFALEQAQSGRKLSIKDALC